MIGAVCAIGLNAFESLDGGSRLKLGTREVIVGETTNGDRFVGRSESVEGEV